MRRLYWSGELNTRCGAIIHGFDAVHLHSVFLFPTWAGARIANKLRVPYVLSPRGMLVRELIMRRSTVLKWSWISLIERRNLARAAKIHLTSSEEQRALMDLGLCLAPTQVIPNGAEPPIPFSMLDISPDVRELVSRRFDILCFGRINWKKGLDRLIQSVAALRGATAVIAGYDEELLAVKLRSIDNQHRVGDRIFILARQINGADKEALFSAARLFALPSVSENFGNVVAEAMIRKLPVVVTASVGAAEIVNASKGGLVAPADPSGFASVLESVLDCDERLAAMGTAGEAFARTSLSWGHIARQFESLYCDMLSDQHGGSRPYH
jgi:glycosyltransferase involved in cell wall biosynthesis